MEINATTTPRQTAFAAPTKRTTNSSFADRMRPKEKREANAKKPTKDKNLKRRFQDPLNTIERQMAALLPIAPQKSATIAVATSPTTSTKSLSPAALEQLVDRVQMGVNAKGDSTFHIAMKGEILDGLRVQVSIDKGKLHVAFISENAEVRKQLDENSRNLEQSMKARGLTLASLETQDPQEKRREQQRQQHQRDREQSFDT